MKKIMTNNSLKIPKALIHIFGVDNAVYIMIASEYAQKTVGEKFKMPIQAVNGVYGITRFKQVASCDYFVEKGILEVEDGECLSEGKNYMFDQEAINMINNIVVVVDERDFSKFKNRAKTNIIGKNLDLNKLCAIVEKF